MTFDELSDAFLYAVMDELSFATGPLYALLHEACYAQGCATRWAAQRIRAEFAEFDPGINGAAPLYFTGEMIYPWMIDGDPVLRPFRRAAELLAERDGWPPLYDPSRLAANEVPVAAAVRGRTVILTCGVDASGEAHRHHRCGDCQAVPLDCCCHVLLQTV